MAMKRIVPLIYVCLALSGSWSCVNEDYGDCGFPPAEEKAVSFVGRLGDATRPLTRATEETEAWTLGKRVGIFMLPAGESISKALYKNTLYAISGLFASSQAFGELRPLTRDFSQMTFPADDKPVDFLAYSPFSSDVDTKTGLLHQNIAEQGEPQTIDFLYSCDALRQTAEQAEVELGFYHQMAKLQVRVHSSEQSGIDLSGMQATLEGLPFRGDFSLGTGKFMHLVAGSPFDMARIPAKPGFEKEEAEFQAIIFPHGSMDFPGRQMVFKIQDGFSLQLPAADTFFKKGQIYQYDIYLLSGRPEDAKVSGLIFPWDNEDYESVLHPDD